MKRQLFLLTMLSTMLLVGCFAKQDLQKPIYVVIPEEYLVDCELPLTKGFDNRDLVIWGLNLSKSIKACNLRLEQARNSNQRNQNGQTKP